MIGASRQRTCQGIVSDGVDDARFFAVGQGQFGTRIIKHLGRGGNAKIAHKP